MHYLNCGAPPSQPFSPDLHGGSLISDRGDSAGLEERQRQVNQREDFSLTEIQSEVRVGKGEEIGAGEGGHRKLNPQ